MIYLHKSNGSWIFLLSKLDIPKLTNDTVKGNHIESSHLNGRRLLIGNLNGN
ncbi:MAG: hypothetical protein ACI4WH_02850 [Oscillospiraceae bacterium]